MRSKNDRCSVTEATRPIDWGLGRRFGLSRLTGVAIVMLLFGASPLTSRGEESPSEPTPAASENEDQPASSQPVPQSDSSTDSAIDQQEMEVEPLARGPIHEAFAEPIELGQDDSLLVPKSPPERIEEIPPEGKPDGDRVVWIPGYWSWDDERSDFIWISGVWRHAPVGREWVPGYWTEEGGQYRWVPGFWAPEGDGDVAHQVERIPVPPDSLENGPNREAPSEDHFWVPGTWKYQTKRYVWRPGFWSPCHEDWIWVPDHYVSLGSECVYVPGYWDYAWDQRGILYAPCTFNYRRYRYGDYYYRPQVAIDIAGAFLHLWIRPHYRHYYFGDYYDSRYRRYGIRPWYSYHRPYRRAYDPLFVHYRWRFGRERVNLYRHFHGHHDHYRRNVSARPRHHYGREFAGGGRRLRHHQLAFHASDLKRGGRGGNRHRADFRKVVLSGGRGAKVAASRRGRTLASSQRAGLQGRGKQARGSAGTAAAEKSRNRAARHLGTAGASREQHSGLSRGPRTAAEMLAAGQRKQKKVVPRADRRQANARADRAANRRSDTQRQRVASDKDRANSKVAASQKRSDREARTGNVGARRPARGAAAAAQQLSAAQRAAAARRRASNSRVTKSRQAAARTRKSNSSAAPRQASGNVARSRKGSQPQSNSVSRGQTPSRRNRSASNARQVQSARRAQLMKRRAVSAAGQTRAKRTANRVQSPRRKTQARPAGHQRARSGSTSPRSVQRARSAASGRGAAAAAAAAQRQSRARRATVTRRRPSSSARAGVSRSRSRAAALRPSQSVRRPSRRPSVSRSSGRSRAQQMRRAMSRRSMPKRGGGRAAGRRAGGGRGRK